MAFTMLNCNLRSTADSVLHIVCIWMYARYTYILHSTLLPYTSVCKISYPFCRLVRFMFFKFLIYASSIRIVACYDTGRLWRHYFFVIKVSGPMLLQISNNRNSAVTITIFCTLWDVDVVKEFFTRCFINYFYVDGVF